jgi:hypothetical protein
MSSHAAVAVAVPVPVGDPGSDKRWADWVRKGVTGDRQTQRRTLWFTAIVGCGLIAWLAAALLLR